MIHNIRRYGIYKSIYLLCCLLRTKFVNKKIRLIRFPIDIRNREEIDFGYNLTTGIGCRLEVEGSSPTKSIKRLVFGANVQINDYVHITASQLVKIEDNVLIASKVYISDSSHGCYGGIEIHDDPHSIPKERTIYSAPVILKENVWLGENVAVLKGVTIGKGSIVGANSVVTKNIPDFTIAAGNPARPIKKFSFEQKKWEKI